MNYTQLYSFAQNIMNDETNDADWVNIFPAAIQDSENRCYRALDMLATRGTDTSVTLSTSTRNATCPATITIVEGIAILTPAGNVPPNATRIPLERASIDFIDSFYGNEQTQAVPQFFAMLSDTNIVIAPTADQAYKIEITGTTQPAPMASGNPTTPLGTYFPDLFLAGVMQFLAGWQQNYGAQSDNPQFAQSWETKFKDELQSALEYVQRQKSQDPNWNPLTPTPLSTPRT